MSVKEEKTKPQEEWIWVDGYKGFNYDLTCRDMQYEIGGEYSMPAEEVSLCESGYHLCLKLSDVFEYYAFSDDKHCNRFCKVKALVRKEDFDNYGKYKATYLSHQRIDKIVARSIKIIEEISKEKIVSTLFPNYDYEFGKNTLIYGPDIAFLIKIGYKVETAKWIHVTKQNGFAKVLMENDEFTMKEKLTYLIERKGVIK